MYEPERGAKVKEIDFLELVSGIARILGKRLAPFAAAEGLSITESLVLFKVRRKGRRATELADQIGLPPSTVTGILDRLEAGGWILREGDPTDRRALVMRGTAKTDELFKGMTKTVTKSLEKSFKDLPPGLLERVIVDLGLVLDCLKGEEATR